MNNNYQYKLDNSSRKFLCPKCGQRRFVCYVDSLTTEYVDEKFGRCDREDSCGYHLHPYADKSNKAKRRYFQRPVVKTKQPLVYVPQKALLNTLKGYEQNNFIQNLLNNVAYPFSQPDVEKVIGQYYLGTLDLGAGRRSGSHKGYATTFPFIDTEGNVRAIQAKLFDDNNHTTKTTFLHKVIEGCYTRACRPIPKWIEAYNKNDLKVSCLFGAHLLNKYPRNPIALVEAPKTAIYGTLYFGFPDDETKPLWLAVYNKSSLTLDKCKVLEGRRVFLFPDLSTKGSSFEEWGHKAILLEKQIRGTRFMMSDLLENNASTEERNKGLDLADFLIKQDWRDFR